MKNKGLVKITSNLLVFSLILSCLIFSVNIYAADIYEEAAYDSNNDVSLHAISTADDNNNYGVIRSSSDVDFWDLGFDEPGMANFYLQSPPGCNYNFRIYKYVSGGDSEPLEIGANGGIGEFDLIRLHVDPSILYEIKVYSSSGISTENYLLRAKNYPDTTSFLHTSEYNTSLGTPTPLANACKTELNNLGFDTVYDLYNYTANSVFNRIKNSDICVLYSENNSAGIIKFQAYNTSNTYLSGKYHSLLTTYSKSFTDYASGALSGTDLIVFAGSYTGKTSTAYGNLVDEAVNKGAFCALGWVESVDLRDMRNWLALFFGFSQNRNIVPAMSVADRYLDQNQAYNYAGITNKYYNDANAHKLYLDRYPG